VQTWVPRSLSTSSAARAGCDPSACVVVATLRALKYQGGADLKTITTEDLGALEKGLVNLERHVDNVHRVYGMPCVVAINHFNTDTPAEISVLIAHMAALGVRVVLTTHWADGGRGHRAGTRRS
jgi:formate--tetrahydrofolate ligase